MVTVSYLLRHDNLLQNATDVVTKCDSYFIAKCEFCYKMRDLLQSATFITKFVGTDCLFCEFDLENNEIFLS